MGSLAVEFACSSITAANFDENLDPASALLAEQCLNQPCPFPFGTNYNPNPHLKYTDLDRHGYFILDVKPDSVQANFYFVGAILSPNSTQMFDKGAYTLDGENHLILSTTESGPKAVQDIPAPAIPMNTTAIGEPQLTALLLGVYPNPASNLLTIQYAVNHPEAMRLELLTLDGKEVLSVPLGIQANGMYKTDLNISDLSQGVYLLRFHTGNSISGTRKFVVIR
jgi:alkaline phosphatase D